jgi:hypothetical protein
MNCDLCASEVRVESSKEGTSYYINKTAEQLQTAKEIIVNFLEHRGEPAEADGVVKTVLRAREFLLAPRD